MTWAREQETWNELFGPQGQYTRSIEWRPHMGISTAGRRNANFNFEGHFEALKFHKKGAEIQTCINKTLRDVEQQQTTNSKAIEVICKERGVDVKEVLDAGENTTAHESYSNKALTNAPKLSDMLNELANDLSKLREFTFANASLKRTAENLQRIYDNVEPARSFDLTYDELTLLGF